MNQCVWHFPSTVLHPARSGAGEALFFVCGFQSCSRKRGRLDWHQPNILQLAQVAWCSSAPKITAVLLGHGSFSPHHYHTRTLGGVTGWERGFEGLCRWCWWLLPLPWGCVRGRSSLPSFPGELGGGLWPCLSCGPIDPFDRCRRPSPALRDPDPPCGAAEGGGSSPSLDDAHPSTCPRSWCHRA